MLGIRGGGGDEAGLYGLLDDGGTTPCSLADGWTNSGRMRPGRMRRRNEPFSAPETQVTSVTEFIHLGDT